MIITQLTRIFLNYLYRPFAGIYDAVAYLVSFGHWADWIKAILPLLSGDNILEIGFGTGHLLNAIRHRQGFIAGMDASPQMVRITSKRIGRSENSGSSGAGCSLVRANANHIPFQTGFFDCVVATFPTSYIFEVETLANIHRVLHPEGQLVVLLSASPEGKTLSSKALAWLYRVTGENAANNEKLIRFLQEQFSSVGFSTEIIWKKVQNATLMIIMANPHKNL